MRPLLPVLPVLFFLGSLSPSIFSSPPAPVVSPIAASPGPALLDPSGRWELTASGAQVWTRERGKPAIVSRFIGHAADVISMKVSADSRFLVTGSRDGSARVWDFPAARELYRLPVGRAPMVAVDISADGSTVLVASDRVRVWEPSTGRILRDDGPESGGLITAAWSADGRRELIATHAGRVKVLDAQTGECLWLGGLPHLREARFSPDGRWVAAVADGAVVRWNVTD